MAETTMPATEANVANEASERMSYEFAFHILPTVAEEEVTRVFEELKTQITKTGAEIYSEEAPERIELAYEIVKQSEGKNKKYGSAYFGWARFKVESEQIAVLKEAIETNASILRYLLIKLTRVEEAQPFRFHEQRKSDRMVEVFDEEGESVLADPLLGEGSETKDSKKSTDAEEKSVEEEK